VLLNEGSDLLVGAVGSVRDSDEEVLGGGAVNLLVVNSVDAVDEDDLQVCLEVFVVEFELVEGLSDFLFEVSGLSSVALDYLISSIEHLCLLCVALRNFSLGIINTIN